MNLLDRMKNNEKAYKYLSAEERKFLQENWKYVQFLGSTGHYLVKSHSSFSDGHTYRIAPDYNLKPDPTKTGLFGTLGAWAGTYRGMPAITGGYAGGISLYVFDDGVWREEQKESCIHNIKAYIYNTNNDWVLCVDAVNTPLEKGKLY